MLAMDHLAAGARFWKKGMRRETKGKRKLLVKQESLI
jgi:hypothetical protein